MIEMGIGALGGSRLQHVMKNRFTFELTQTCVGSIGKQYCKVASRPNLSIDENPIEFLNETDWIPGKARWETINVSYYDVTGADNPGAKLMSWVSSVYNISAGSDRAKQSSTRAGYSGVGVLVMYDGCGSPIQQWTLNNCWPTNINFGDLDAGDGSPAMIDLTLRYSRVTFQSFCGGSFNPCPCVGC